MSNFHLAKRLEAVPPYLFAQIDKVKNEVKARGLDIISLGIGDPDTPTPDFILKAMAASIQKPENHQYPSYIGLLSFRRSVADWYKRRFGVELDPQTEVLSLIGSKEGLAHFPLAFCNPGDLVLVSSPNYPVYPVASAFAGAESRFLPLTRENNFLPDLDAVSNDDWRRAKMIFVNYPTNPTAATAPRSFFEKLVAKAREFGTIVVQDAAYSEVYFDEANKPMSILEIPGARDGAIEFHSLSKTYNMTGWRIGMAVGNAQLVQGLGKVKENMDSGIFQAIQEAGIVGLEQGDDFCAGLRKMYKERRDVMVAGLKRLGFDCPTPEATFYLWVPTPKGSASAEFVTRLIEKTGVVCTPGNGFGGPGEGYFRIALTVGVPRLEEALERIAQR